MCEYCGCQQVDSIAELTAEHDAIRSVMERARAAVARDDLAEAKRCAQLMLEQLAPHTAVEERGLFPALAGEYPDHVARLEAEHRDIDGALGALASGACQEHWHDRTAAVLDELFEHILREQDGLFPAALATLRPEQWDEVAAVRAATRSGVRAAAGPAPRPVGSAG